MPQLPDGMPTLHLLTVCGFVGWEQEGWALLLPTIQAEMSSWGSPHAIIIQLGENNFLREKGFVLSRNIISDLSLLHYMLPSMALIWSGLLEQREWRDALDPE